MPSVVINQVAFRGHVTADNVFEAACSIPDVLPAGCSKFYNKKGKIEWIGFIRNSRVGLKKRTMMIIVAILVCVNLIFFYFYRKNMQEEAARDVKVQVQSAVSQYVALSQISELN